MHTLAFDVFEFDGVDPRSNTTQQLSLTLLNEVYDAMCNYTLRVRGWH